MTFSLRLLCLLTLVGLAACDSGPDGETSDVVIGGDYSATTETFSDGQTVTTFAIPTTPDGEGFSYTVSVRTERGSNVTSSTSSGTGTYAFPRVTFTTDNVPLTGTVESDGAVLEIANPNGGTFRFRR